MSGQRHPDPETLASLRAGLFGGLRGRRLAAHVARCARCAATGEELAAVSSLLASAPTPLLPESFEQRISAALAAEAGARALTANSSAETDTSPAALSPAGADPGIAGEHAGARVPAERPKAVPSRRHGPALRFRPAMAFVPLVLFLLAGFGYLLSTIGGQPSNSSSSQAFSTASPSSAAVPAAGERAAPSRPGTFVVTASGLNYLPRTLGTQVRLEMTAQYSSGSGQQQLGSNGSGGASRSAFSGAATSIPSGFAAASSNLTGCVLRVTGGVQPSLVDKAAYQGRPVYVIAVPARAWVVERGCTASHPAIITSVALTAGR